MLREYAPVVVNTLPQARNITAETEEHCKAEIGEQSSIKHEDVFSAVIMERMCSGIFVTMTEETSRCWRCFS